MWRWQDCLDDNGWLDVASTIVSVNGRHFWILLYSILICIVLDAPWSYIVCCFRSFQFEEEEQEVPSTFVANIHHFASSPFWSILQGLLFQGRIHQVEICRTPN